MHEKIYECRYKYVYTYYDYCCAYYIYIEIKTLGHQTRSRAVCEATGLGYSSALSGTSLNTPLVSLVH